MSESDNAVISNTSQTASSSQSQANTQEQTNKPTGIVPMTGEIISVRSLLTKPTLSIPAYQRPYKWTQENLHAMLDDLQRYRHKSAYRLGTVVFHRHMENGQEQVDIVDGQQRTLTLVLLVRAILQERAANLLRKDLKDQLEKLKPKIDCFLQRQHFTSDISHQNLQQNFMAATRAVTRTDFTEDDIDFLLNKCQLVTFTLNDISEAFQFFDSQNARGRDLDPHDLLKAFHLREFADHEHHLKSRTVSHWESLESATLSTLFANYLYRVRHWAQDKSAQYFNKSKIGVFKGVNLDQVGAYPYVQSLRIAHHFVNDYNSQYQRRIDHQNMHFPFQLDQMVINGRRFFEMASHYQQMITQMTTLIPNNENARARLLDVELGAMASKILWILNSYSARTRTGDQYIRTLFDCVLIFYIDKFGTQSISLAIEKLFIWAYTCRLKMQVVQLATMDSYALENNVFERIKHAVQPSEALNWPLVPIKASEVRGTKLGEIICLFTELKYYE